MSKEPFADVRSLVEERVPDAPKNLLVYVMGAYTTSSPSHLMKQSPNRLTRFFSKFPLVRNSYPADPIFEFSDDSTEMYGALSGLCKYIRTHDKLGHRAFLATDVDIPTKVQAQNNPDIPDDAGVDPLTQSFFYAAVSNAVLFVFSKAGVNDGVATELGGIASMHNLDDIRTKKSKKHPDRFMYLVHRDVGSATLTEVPVNISLVEGEYCTSSEIHAEIDGWLRQIEHMDSPATASQEPVHRFGSDEVSIDLRNWNI